MGDAKLVDSMICDGLWMPSTTTTWHDGGELAKKFSIRVASRTNSRRLEQKAEAAQKSGKFKDEITP